jgi:hypothetical protein
VNGRQGYVTYTLGELTTHEPLPLNEGDNEEAKLYQSYSQREKRESMPQYQKRGINHP